MEIDEKRLLQQLCYELHTMVRVLDNEHRLLAELRPEPDFDDSGILFEGIAIRHFEPAGSVPVIYSINRTFCYSAFRIMDRWYFFGPMCCTVPFSCRHEFRYGLAEDRVQMLLSKLKPLPLGRIAELICLLPNCALNQERETMPLLGEQDVLLENQIRTSRSDEVLSDVTSTVFANLESGYRHNPYDEEVREMAAVERGDTELLARILNETYYGNIGILADDALRHTKNLGVVIITIASRAAIRGGVPYEMAFSMSDRFIQELEQKTSVAEAEEYSRFAEFQYASTVRDYQQALRTERSGKENEHVERCKNYIFRNLHGKIRVSEMAEMLALNANYLSTVFKKHEGVTIGEYILRQKLLLVRNLLIYSEYSFLEITNYLGFPSQSYLGKRFKEETGMTLKEYRTRYQVRDFIYPGASENGLQQLQ